LLALWAQIPGRHVGLGPASGLTRALAAGFQREPLYLRKL